MIKAIKPPHHDLVVPGDEVYASFDTIDGLAWDWKPSSRLGVKVCDMDALVRRPVDNFDWKDINDVQQDGDSYLFRFRVPNGEWCYGFGTVIVDSTYELQAVSGYMPNLEHPDFYL